MFALSFISILSLVATVLSAATPILDACQQISKVYNSSSSGAFEPSLALQCSRSVPFNQTACRAQLVEIRNFLAFESTQDYWVDAPANVSLPSFNMNETLDSISKNVESNRYASKYDFDIEVRSALANFHNAHTLYFTSAISSFVYYHRYPLTSIAKTPDSQPAIYLADLDTGGPKMDSEVVKINGQDAATYLLNLATKALDPTIYWTDIDTRYNQLFVPQSIPELRNTELENLGLFANREVYPTDVPKLTLANGKTITVDWHAMYNYWFEENLAQPPNSLPFWNQASFEAMGEFATFTGPPTRGLASSPKATFVENLTPYSPGPPAIRQLEHNAAAYYVIDKAFGVIRLPLFITYGFNQDVDQNQYVEQVLNLLDEALNYFKDNNIGKVVIDVTHNGGGDIVAGFAFFQRFFPKAQSPKIYQNMRWSPQIDAATRTASKHNDADSLPTDLTTFGVAYDDQASGDAFPSVDTFLGPVPGPNNNGLFTKLSSRDMEGSIKLFGYNTATLPKQLFTADQIVLFGDTFCGSTCSTFAQMMADQGVRSVAYGGRPGRSTLQFSGGIKGRQTFTYYDWLRSSSSIPNTKANNVWLPQRPPYAMALSVNLVNGFDGGVGGSGGQGEGGVAGWPREMIYEASTKSVYLTGDMAVRPSERWRVAAREIWG